MQTNNIQPPVQTLADQVNAALVIPLKFLVYLFTPVIDLLINLPVMNAVYRERQTLKLLTNTRISDIGLDHHSIRKEIKRGYFDIPADRKRSWRNVEPNFMFKPF